MHRIIKDSQQFFQKEVILLEISLFSVAILSFNILRHSDMQKGEKPIRLIFPSGHILWNDQNLHHHYQHNHHYDHHYKRSPILIIIPASAPTVFAVAAVVAFSAWAENLRVRIY